MPKTKRPNPGEETGARVEILKSMHKDIANSTATQQATKSVLESPVTLLLGTKPTPTDYSTLGEVFCRMQTTDTKKRENVLTLRQVATDAKSTGNEKHYKDQKEKLFGFLVGIWSHRADAPENCKEYIPILVLDFDYSASYELEEPPFSNELCRGVFEKVCADTHTYAAFLSPSGGLRVLVVADCNYHNHRETYARLMAYYSSVTGRPIVAKRKIDGKLTANTALGIDPSCSNESRFFYFVEGLTPDEFFRNENYTVFPSQDALQSTQGATTTTTEQTIPSAAPRQKTAPTLTEADRWELYEKMTDERHSPTANAGRNGRVFYLAQLAHEHGFNESDILSYCEQFKEPGFDTEEIKATVKSAVKRTNGARFTPEQQANYKAKVERQPNEAKAKHKKSDSKEKAVNAYNAIVAHLKSHHEFQMDIVGNELEHRKKGASTWEVLNENNLLHELRGLGHRVTDTLLMSLLGSDFVPRFDPFLNYFKGLKYHPEAGSHIERLASFVALKDETDRELFTRTFKKTLVRVAAGAVGRIQFNKQCFVLKSDQNDGKSTFIRWLCPPVLAKYRADWTRDEVGDKDGRFAIAQNFLINLDELATFGKANIEQTKAIMSLDSIKDRPPYGKRPIRFPRRASFFGSTNKDQFLTDESGSVRWLVFEIAGIQHDNGGMNGYNAQIDINAVWAEAWHLLNTGEVEPQMTREEIAESEARNRLFQVTTQEMEMVMQFLSKSNKDALGAEFLPVADITNYLAGISAMRLNRNAIGAALKYLGWEKAQRFDKVKGYQVWGFWLEKVATQQTDFE